MQVGLLPLLLVGAIEAGLCDEVGYVARNRLNEVKRLMLRPAPAFVQGPFFGYQLDAT